MTTTAADYLNLDLDRLSEMTDERVDLLATRGPRVRNDMHSGIEKAAVEAAVEALKVEDDRRFAARWNA